MVFHIQLIWCGLYSLYTLWTLNLSMIHGVDATRYGIFGVHLGRTLLATTLTYWGYAFFVAHADEHQLLYNFVQKGEGKLLKFKEELFR